MIQRKNELFSTVLITSAVVCGEYMVYKISESFSQRLETRGGGGEGFTEDFKFGDTEDLKLGGY